MVDFHSHILPGFDDGAKDVQMSLEMLRKAYNDGIDTVVSSSHAYVVSDESIEKFIEERDRSYKILCDAMEADGGEFPKILLGAEVHIKSFLTDLKKLVKLAIEGTDYILIEMPYSDWKQEHYESVYNCTVYGLKPIIAHADRYIERAEKFRHLKAFGSIFQINADSFLNKSLRKKLLTLFYDGYAHILGSDMHNCDVRPNRMKEAYEAISSNYDARFVDYINKNAERALNNKNVYDEELPNISFIKRMML